MASFFAGAVLQSLHIAYVPAMLSVHAYMQRLHPGGSAQTRAHKRPVARRKTHNALQSMGWQRLRPCAMTPDLSNFSDIHTHGHTGRDIITSIEPDEDITDEYGTAWYSVGIHPWSTTAPIASAIISRLRKLAHDRRVIAIGEAGFDKKRGGAIEYQAEIFLLHAALAEETRKPLIIHCVGRYGLLKDLHRELSPSQPWIIHGFTGKPELARQLVAEGFFFSLRPDSPVRHYGIIPEARLFTESD